MKRSVIQFSLTLLLGLFCPVSFAQTYLIDPNGDGGFESPGGFAANGWTVVNAPMNQWISGSIAVPYQGGQSAFVSPNLGANWVYDITTSSTSHIYTDITVPIGENLIQLNFWYKNPGEPLFDRLLVYTAPTSVTPVANSPLDGAVNLPGATLLFTDPAGVQNYTNVNITLPSSLAGTTFRLIFTWQNDNLDGTAIPVSLDNVSLTSQNASFGAPLNGVYTINNTLPTGGSVPASGSNFNNFSDAIGYLNSYGIAGDVRFEVAAGQTFVHNPLTISSGGNTTDTISFVKVGSGNNPLISSSNGTGATGGDAAITLNGVDFITFDGIDVQTQLVPSSSVTNIECGFKFINASGVNGAQSNRILNCSIYMNKIAAYSSNCAILVNTNIAPTSAAGANSFNEFRNVTINNTVFGIRSTGSAAFRDDGLKITDCKIGEFASNSLGGITGQVFGIYVLNAQNSKISGNTVKNVTTTGAVDGVFISALTGNNEISNNVVQAVRNAGTTSTGVATGIRVIASPGAAIRLFNNAVSGISTAYNTVSGTNPAPILVKGLSIQPTGSAAGAVIHVDFNNVSINGSATSNISSTCLEIFQTTPQVNIRNNVLANFTTNQTGNGFHYAMVVPNFSLAAAGGVSNFNDFYVPNAGNGVLVRKTTATITNYTSLSTWGVASAQDANSISADPVFTNADSDLHVFSASLDQTGSMNGITWILNDMDDQARPTVPDIGADEFSMIAYDLSAMLFVLPDSIGCFDQTEQTVVRIRNNAYQAHDFVLNPATLSVQLNGPIAQTVSFTISDNSLNGSLPLNSGDSLDVLVGVVDMSLPGSYTLNGEVNFASDMVITNNAIAQSLILINSSADTLPQHVSFDGFNGTNLGVTFPGWKEGSNMNTLNGSNGWGASSGVSNPLNITASFNLNVGENTAFMLSPKFACASNTLLTFDLALTAAFSNNGNGQFDLDDTLEILTSTDCGQSFQSLAIFTADSSVSNTLSNFEIPLGQFDGLELILAFKGSDGVQSGVPACVHLDNIWIEQSNLKRVRISSVLPPLPSPCFSNDEHLSVVISNTGYDTIFFAQDPILIPIFVNNVLIGVDTLNIGSLLPGDQTIFNSVLPIDLSIAGRYDIEVITQLDLDTTFMTDSSQIVVYSQNPTLVFDPSDSVCYADQHQVFAHREVYGITTTILPRFQSTGNIQPIPDNNASGIQSPITVSGTGGYASQLFEVRIDSLAHTNLTDLDFYLFAPDGSSILLTAFNQGNGPGYTLTAFRDTASSNFDQDVPPYTGYYPPQQAFSVLTGPANGNWELQVRDLVSGNTGVFYSWSMLFYEGNGLNSYSWTALNAGTAQTDSSFSFTAITNDEIIYEFTDQTGCLVKDTLTLSVSHIQVVDTLFQNSSCFGSNDGMAGVDVVGGLGNIQYTWNTSPVQTTSQINGLDAGTYTVIIEDTLGCSESVTISLTEPTELILSAVADSITCSGCAANVALFASGGTPPYSGTGLFDEFNPGLNTYTVTDANGCQSTIDVFIEDVSGITELGFEVKIYPNPVTDHLVIDLLKQIDLGFTILDAQGRTVSFGMLSQGIQTIDLSTISSGTYILYLVHSENRYVYSTIIKN